MSIEDKVKGKGLRDIEGQYKLLKLPDKTRIYGEIKYFNICNWTNAHKTARKYSIPCTYTRNVSVTIIDKIVPIQCSKKFFSTLKLFMSKGRRDFHILLLFDKSRNAWLSSTEGYTRIKTCLRVEEELAEFAFKQRNNRRG